MTTTTRTNTNGQPRKTLASQLDRLDGILDGLDAALAGAVQEAVEQAVKQAVQAVLTEVLANREFQEHLQQVTQPTPPPEPPRVKQSMLKRLWQATTGCVQRTVQTVKKFGRGVGIRLLAAGGAVAGVIYAARKQIVSVGTAVFRNGRQLVSGAISVLMSFVPSFVFGG
ncbi:MAG TPA: hypothetical protein VH592_09180 [Gemmataceae bacterium]|jgi:hypothetical protein